MKRFLIIFVLILFSTLSFTQNKSINYLNWSNPITFKTSPMPVVVGFGEYSDSLAEVYDGKTFFANGDEYYQIESWADYYYWFSQKYWYKFNQPELYEFFYLTENDYEMARYIATQYVGLYYPVNLVIDLKEDDKEVNRTKETKNFPTGVRGIQLLKKDLDNPINKVKVRTYAYDINNKPPSKAKSKVRINPFDHENPQQSGVRTFNTKKPAKRIKSRASSSGSKSKPTKTRPNEKNMKR